MCLQLFMLYLVHAYGSRVWRPAAKHPRTSQYTSDNDHRDLDYLWYLDGPWRLFWPVLVPWSCLEAVVCFTWLYASKGTCASCVVSVCALSALLHYFVCTAASCIGHVHCVLQHVLYILLPKCIVCASPKLWCLHHKVKHMQMVEASIAFVENLEQMLAALPPGSWPSELM